MENHLPGHYYHTGHVRGKVLQSNKNFVLCVEGVAADIQNVQNPIKFAPVDGMLKSNKLLCIDLYTAARTCSILTRTT